MKEYLTDIERAQIERFHKKYGDKEKLEKVIQCVQKKYSSDKYLDRYYKMGQTPPRFFMEFLLRYAAYHGQKLSDNEDRNYRNMFTGQIYGLYDYIIHEMKAPTPAIIIHKKGA